LSPEEILQSPYVLIGTADKRSKIFMRAGSTGAGISCYVMFEPHVDVFAPVVARLAEG
jgi:hypothetical protein